MPSILLTLLSVCIHFPSLERPNWRNPTGGEGAKLKLEGARTAMPDPIPSCFRGTVAGGPPASTATGPNLTTSIYETYLGLASLTWSRTVLGLSLRADLGLSPPSDGADHDEDEGEVLRFRIRPWLFWKRRGSRRFRLKDGVRDLDVDVAWDLTRARFPSAGGPEPSSNFFVAVAVDGEMTLVAGDMDEEAHRKMKAKRQISASQVSRKEHVVLKGDAGAGGRRSYLTTARISGRERQISIELGGKEKEASGMSIFVDGLKVLQVRRLRWKFRGSERIDIDGEGCRQIQISWDLYSWLFKPRTKRHPPLYPAPLPPRSGKQCSFSGSTAAALG
ncbi:hypothetical protein HPP92_017508 [Vanilla planifolia]|uniref:Uncharacterized protein n=1 Tax=Vanilla planifolia TaxID=51239 RepID=A0A835QLH5_VANPL|nr:hypothetical protein HPP92_017508 [Vanilla planifolia]